MNKEDEERIYKDPKNKFRNHKIGNGNSNIFIEDEVNIEEESYILDDSMKNRIDKYINEQIEKKFGDIDEKLKQVREGGIIIGGKTGEITVGMLLEEKPSYEKDYDFENYKILCLLKLYLKENGITQSWLCEKTKISQGTMSTIVNNTTPVSLENAYKISMVLGITLESIFEFRPKSKQIFR